MTAISIPMQSGGQIADVLHGPLPACGIVRLISAPSFDPSLNRRDMQVPQNSTIAQMVDLAMAGLPSAPRKRLRVMIGDRVVDRQWWAFTRPKPGTVVLIRAVPANDGILRTVMTIAVTVAAIAFSNFLAPVLLSGIGLAGNALALGATKAFITAGTMLAGSLLINALVPVRSGDRDRPSYSIQGLRNQATPDGVVPMVLGKIRIAPPYLTTPWTESFFDYRYVTAGFLVGYGPVAYSAWRIGETPIERFIGVNLETRQGYAADARLALCPSQVIEDPFSITLTQFYGPTAGPQTRFTASDCSSCSFDVSFPGGLFAANKDGGTMSWTVVIVAQYRKVGDVAWTPVGALPITGKDRKLIVRTFAIQFPERGRYEVSLARATTDWDDVDQSKRDIQHSGRSVWTALRSFRPEYPVNFPYPLAVAAVKILATGQLNGMLDELNVVASSICEDWDTPTQTWIARETNNPAALFRHVLMSKANAYPLDLDEIDEALKFWYVFCRDKGLTYNRYLTEEASLFDVLSDIAAAGRASPHDNGETWGVVIDRALDIVSAHVTPRNSWGFEWERRYASFPDGFRVSFKDETNDYQQGERVVPWPGFEGTPERVERIDMPGVTDPDMIWRETRRRQYELIHRGNTFWAMQDFESIGILRGDRVQGTFDVLDTVMVAGRVLAASDETVALDEIVTMEEGKTYAIRFRRDDGTSLLRTVVTVPGETRHIRLTGEGDIPEVQNIFQFGLAGQESRALTVKGIEAMENFCARLTFVDHAPQIEQLVDDEEPPAWDGRAGGPIQEITGIPLAPTIGEVVSGFMARESASDTIPYPVVVPVLPNPMGTVPVAQIAVRHRLVGAGSWQPDVVAPLISGSAIFGGYVKGNQVEIEAWVISNLGTASARTAAIVHEVGATDPASPLAPVYDSVVRLSGTNTVEHKVIVPVDPQVRSLRFSRVRGFGKVYADVDHDTDRVVSALSGQVATSQDTISLGYYQWWVRAIGDYGLASAEVGPRSLHFLLPNGNVATAPNDIGNAAWTKQFVTAGTPTTGPDGVAATATPLLETTATNLHRVYQSQPCTSGNRVYVAAVFRPNGRNTVRLGLWAAAGVAQSASVDLDMTAGTLGAIVYAGTAVTAATAEVVKVSATDHLVILGGLVAGTTAFLGINLLNDLGASSYAGDAAKGVTVSNASIRPT